MRIAAALLPLAAVAAALAPPALAATATIAPYGVLKDGRKVDQITLTNDRGMVVKIINYGAIVTDMIVPDAQGHKANVVLGFGGLADYEAKNGDYAFGAVMGRYAGRIARARFTLGGKEIRLVANDGPNALHGGPNGLFTKVWTMGAFRHGRVVGATLHYISPDREQGFPGQLDIQVTYTLEPDNALRIEYAAATSKPTVLNLTNHSYFNLAGEASGTVLHHRLQIFSDKLMESDQGGIPDGSLLPVAGTPFDFREPKPIETMIDRPHPQMEGRRGFNHSWILPFDGTLHLAARLEDPSSGRQLEVLTTEPSLTVYTGNYFSGRDAGAQGVAYRPYDGIALEAQHLSDSPNRPEFPTTLLNRGEIFRSTTIYRFSTAGAR